MSELISLWLLKYINYMQISNVVDKFLQGSDKFMPEIHVRQSI